MTTAIFTHAACLGHDPLPGHPECPDRLRAVLRRLKQPEFADLLWPETDKASAGQVLRVHTQALLDVVMQDADHAFDGDTASAAGSADAALHAAGAVCAAVEWVLAAAGAPRNAFCPVRPPGHHAEPQAAMGFCLLNNVALAARHAQSLGARRVAVLDFDVHHGNGTQREAWDDADFFYASSHQWPHYPGSGAGDERGAHGQIINVPLPAGTTGPELIWQWEQRILPALAAFAPDLTLISAGFDGHLADPLGDFELEAADFGRLTEKILKITGPNVVSVLEGGYNLAALADSVAAHVAALQAAALTFKVSAP